MALLEPGEVLERLDLDSDHPKADALAGILEDLEADIEAHLKRPLVPTDVTDEVVTIDARGTVRLASTPVVSVAAFTVDGTAVGADQYEVKAWGMVDVWPGFLPSPLISPAPVLLASYRGGLPGDDADHPFTRKARSVLMRAAIREFNQVCRQDAGGLESLSVEGTAMRFVNPGGGLTEEERKSLDRWKRRISR